jgi:hypothetical protein
VEITERRYGAKRGKALRFSALRLLCCLGSMLDAPVRVALIKPATVARIGWGSVRFPARRLTPYVALDPDGVTRLLAMTAVRAVIASKAKQSRNTCNF